MNLSWWDSVFLGMVQGLTEFLPVSSDGHLVLFQNLLGYHIHNLTFDVLLHMGTLLTLIVYFRKECRKLLTSTFYFLKKPKISSENKWMLYIWVTTGVTGLIGIIFEPFIASTFENMKVASVGFMITSAALFLASRKRTHQKQVAALPWLFPFLLGLMQASALLPGISRSGMTIATALLFGIKNEEAGRFSFVAGIPIIFLAGIYEMRKLTAFSNSEVTLMALGAIVSCLTGFLALKCLFYFLKSRTLYPFAIYTALLGIISYIIL